jgi:phosphoribosylformylglycinamidine cyclo-ligase
VPELDRPVGEVLLTPTRIYAKQVLTLIQEYSIKGIAHITGGGITENLPRVFPPGVRAQVRRSGWNVPLIFDVIAKLGAVARDEMYRVFNMGIGLILVVSPDEADPVMRRATALGDRAYRIGRIVSAKDGEPLVEYVE